MSAREKIPEGIKADNHELEAAKTIEEAVAKIQQTFLIREEDQKDRQNIKEYIHGAWDKPFDVYRESVHAIGKRL
jgi:hypothetical protein